MYRQGIIQRKRIGRRRKYEGKRYVKLVHMRQSGGASLESAGARWVLLDAHQRVGWFAPSSSENC